MRKVVLFMGIAYLVLIADLSAAEIIRGINIDSVSVGNAGNAADITTGYGAVDYNYRIGKYEITNAQWNAFTALSGNPTGNDGGYNLGSYYFFRDDRQPANNVSWYEAAQFCNYLTSGDKSKGVYLFNGNNVNPGSFLGVDRVAAKNTYGVIYVLPTRNEWYKAAYHKNDGITGNYWLYPTQSNVIPSNDLINPDPGNNANFYQNGFTIGSPSYVTSVGEFENSESAYGTYDQGGNISEWNETLDGSLRGMWGGSFDSYASALWSSPLINYDADAPYEEVISFGFRIASIPEPATLSLLSLGLLVLKIKR